MQTKAILFNCLLLPLLRCIEVSVFIVIAVGALDLVAKWLRLDSLVKPQFEDKNTKGQKRRVARP